VVEKTVQELGRLDILVNNAAQQHMHHLHPEIPLQSGPLVLQTAKEVVEKTVQELGRLDILVNNAAQQHMQDDFTQIPPEQLQSTFAINVFGYFYMAQVRVRILGFRFRQACPLLNLDLALMCSATYCMAQVGAADCCDCFEP
jgi:NAD(P)-dependent dehydrogenase (short-subunit alcohol dehydrogenase family)